MDTQKLQIAAVVGSLRSGSVNAAVLRSAIAYAPAHVEIMQFDLAEVPLYNSDLEPLGDPEAVAGLKRAVMQSDGLIIVTPEYNRSVPAVTKNAVDWLSRPHRRNPLVDKPVGVIAATPGRHDAAGAREHLGIAVGAITQNLFPESLGISRVKDTINNQGEVSDLNAANEFAEWVHRFSTFVEATAANRTQPAQPTTQGARE